MSKKPSPSSAQAPALVGRAAILSLFESQKHSEAAQHIAFVLNTGLCCDTAANAVRTMPLEDIVALCELVPAEDAYAVRDWLNQQYPDPPKPVDQWEDD